MGESLALVLGSITHSGLHGMILVSQDESLHGEASLVAWEYLESRASNVLGHEARHNSICPHVREAI